METPTVVSVQLHTRHGQPLKPVPSARGLLEQGLEGDSHSRGRPGRRRQVVIVDVTTLNHFGLEPGDLREQITVRGLSRITLLPPGTRLRAGEVILESSGPCEPCTHIGELLGVDDPELFRQALSGRRGLLCRVVAVTGESQVRVGDSVQVLEEQDSLRAAGSTADPWQFSASTFGGG